MFSSSENYIFGKFDTFCKRLEKIMDMINTMDAYSNLGDVKIEGIETIAVRYKTIVDATKKKNYDILDHRKGDVRIQICSNASVVINGISILRFIILFSTNCSYFSLTQIISNSALNLMPCKHRSRLL